MKPRISLHILVVSIVLCLLGSCERYEEDPWITFRKPIDRVKGKRRITEFTIDGRDTLSFFTNKWGNFYWDFTHDGSHGNMLIRVRDAETHEEIDHGVWNIYTEGLLIHFASFYRRVFPILKCTRDELRLEKDSSYFNLEDLSDSTRHKTLMKLEKL